MLGLCHLCLFRAKYTTAENRDFSENNMKNLNGFDQINANENNLMAVAYLARFGGPVNECYDRFNPNSSFSPTGLPVQKHVQEVLLLPARSGPTDNNMIKQTLISNGPVATGMCYNDNYFMFILYKTYYYNGIIHTNHAVTIVGWDDNFDRNRFYQMFLLLMGLL